VFLYCVMYSHDLDFKPPLITPLMSFVRSVHGINRMIS